MRAGVLIVDIAANLARLQSDMGQAKGIVESGMRDIKATVDTAKTALETLGVTVSVGAFAALIKGTLDSEAALLRLSERAGTSVEVMSSLGSVAKRASTDLDEVASASARLLKNMAESSDGSTKAAKVFDALRISTRDTTGALRAAPEIMQELGSKLMSMRDQGLAAAFATEVLGKNGAALIPFLYELARAGELHASVTTRQAQEAKAFADNLHHLDEQTQTLRRSIANDMLPTLDSWLAKLIAIREASGGGFIGFMAKLGVTGEQAGDPIKAVDELITKVEFLKERLANLQSPDSTGFFGQFATLQKLFNSDDIKITQDQIAYAEKQIQILNALANLQRQKMGRDPGSQYFEFAGGGIPQEVNNPLGINEALTKRFESTLQGLNKEYFNLNHAGTAQLIIYETTVGTLRKLDIERKAELLSIAGEIDDYRNLIEVQKVFAESWAAEVSAIEHGRAAVVAANEAWRTQADTLSFEIKLVGLSARELEKANAVRAVDLDMRRQLAALPRDDSGEILPGATEAMAQIVANADLQKKRVVELVDARQKAERDWLSGVKAGMNEYSDITTNAALASKQVFLDTFHGMEDALIKFVKTGKLNFNDLANTIETDFLRIIIRREITGPLAANSGALFGGLGGLFGAAGAANAASYAAPQTAEEAFLAGSYAPAGAAGGGYGMPMLGAAMAASQGQKMGWQGGMISGAMIGSYFGPWGTAIGAVGGAIIGGAMGGGGDGKDPQLGLLRNPQGQYYISQMDLGGDLYADYMPAMQQLNDRTKYDQAKLATLTGYMSAPAGTSVQAMLATLMQRLSPAALPDLNTLTGQQTALEQQLLGVRDALPGQLGINSLEQYKQSLSVSSMAGGPLDQLASAQSIYDATLAKARGGDITAINQFPQVAQQLLGLGQNAYASGAGFQDLFTNVNKALQEILDQQRGVQADILKDLPVTMKQISIDQIAVTRTSTAAIIEQLKALQDEMARVRAAIAA